MQIMHQDDEITIKIKNLNERFRYNNILAVSRINKLTKREINIKDSRLPLFTERYLPTSRRMVRSISYYNQFDIETIIVTNYYCKL